MAKFIDADDLRQKTFICDEVAEVRKFIENAPAVDAVEVVRCKNCGRWSRNNDNAECIGGLCFYWGDETYEWDFCSYAERGMQ